MAGSSRWVRGAPWVLVGASILFVACDAEQPAAPTRGSTFPAVAPPATFTEVPRPPGAYSRAGADRWYRAPASDGRAVELGVYLPESPIGPTTPTVLVLHGADGLRRTHEDLARAYADAGFIGIAGCWFDQPEAPLIDGAVSCSGGPTFKGTEPAAVDDVDALVAAVGQVPGVDPARLAVVGHSYGGAVALMRASDTGVTEPIVTASAPLARAPSSLPLRTGDRYPVDDADAVDGPVLVMHGRGDPIVPVAQAEAYAAARPATEVRYFPRPAGHAFPWQAEQYPGAPSGTTFGSQFLADTVAWLQRRFP